MEANSGRGRQDPNVQIILKMVTISGSASTNPIYCEGQLFYNTYETYTHAVYTVTKRILYKTYTHKMYTSPPGFSVFAALISCLVLNLWIKLWLM
jgi:hypothetical protein